MSGLKSEEEGERFPDGLKDGADFFQPEGGQFKSLTKTSRKQCCVWPTTGGQVTIFWSFEEAALMRAVTFTAQPGFQAWL